MTSFKKAARYILSGLVAVAVLGLIWMAFQPSETLKATCDALMPDGEFESLSASNVGVFRVLFGAGGAIMLGLVYILLNPHSFYRFWHDLASSLRKDWRQFTTSLRPMRDEKWFLIGLMLIMMIAIIFRLIKIYGPMGHDEAYTWVAFASNPLRIAISDYHLPNNHVLHTILVHFSTRLFGDQPWAVRMPAFLAGVLMAPAVYLFARQFYDRETALLSSLLVAVSPSLIIHSVAARGYTLLALLTLLTFSLGAYVSRHKNRVAWILVTLLSALGFYTIPLMMFPFGILYVWLFLSNAVWNPSPYFSRRDFLIYWFSSGLSTAILVLLLYLPIIIYTGAEMLFANYNVTPLGWSLFLETLTLRLAETWEEWTFSVPPVILVLLGFGLVLSAVVHKRISRHKIALHLAAPIWIIPLLIVQRPNAFPKVWMSLFSIVIVWSAAGIMGLVRLVPLLPRRYISLATAVIALLIGYSAARSFMLLPSLPEEWQKKCCAESMVMFINQQLQEQDLIIVAPPDDAEFRYYSHLYNISKDHFRISEDPHFDRAFILIDPTKGQTLENVIQLRGPDPSALDLNNATMIEQFGDILIYLCPVPVRE